MQSWMNFTLISEAPFSVTFKKPMGLPPHCPSLKLVVFDINRDVVAS